MARSCDPPRLHLQEVVTGANVHRNLTTFYAALHVLTPDIFWTIQNAESNRSGIKHLEKPIIVDAVRRDIVASHLKQ
jgi:hypothetical protein